MDPIILQWGVFFIFVIGVIIISVVSTAASHLSDACNSTLIHSNITILMSFGAACLVFAGVFWTCKHGWGCHGLTDVKLANYYVIIGMVVGAVMVSSASGMITEQKKSEYVGMCGSRFNSYMYVLIGFGIVILAVSGFMFYRQWREE